MNLIQTENKSGKVKLTDAIMPWSVEKLTEDIGKLFGASASAQGADFGVIMNCAENAVDTLEIEINSPGGSIFDGYNIYNEILSLRERGVVVTATVTGMAASMASVICMSCNSVRIVPHGRMMIHEASQGVRGNSDELRKAADLLDGISADIAQIYANRTGKDIDEVRKMMKAETWMNATESVANGFADEVMTAKAKASFDSEPKGMSIFARLFPNDSEAVAKLEAIASENDTLRADLEASQARITELTGLTEANAQLQSELTAATDKASEFENKLTEATAKITKLESAVAITDEKVAARASELLAAQGHPAPVNLTGDDGSHGQSLYDQYRDLKKSDPRAAAKFWDANREAMIAAR